MLPNERFALACRAWYEEQGLVVDSSNGQFAHCPLPERYGDTGYYLLWEHHQQQGLLQSRDVDECCFFVGHAKKWLLECDYWPDDYFELWDIYEKYSEEHQREAGKRGGPAANAVMTPEQKAERARKGCATRHAEKDELGRSVVGVKLAELVNTSMTPEQRIMRSKKAGAATNAATTPEQKTERGRKGGLASHERKDELGKSLHNSRLHSEKDKDGKSVVAKKGAATLHSQTWESTIDGFRSGAGPVARHNKARGWDPNARMRIS